MMKKHPKKKLSVLTHPEFNDSKLKSLGISIIAFCDNIRARSDDTFTVRIRIIHNRYPKYYTTKVNLTQEDYIRMCSDRPGSKLKENRTIIFELLKKAHDIAIEFDEFSFRKFDKLFKPKSNSDKKNVFDWYDEKISKLKAQEKFSTLDTYQNSKTSLMNYCNTKILAFEKITPGFLQGYEDWMLGKNKSISTIGIYLRPLRHIYNRALSEQPGMFHDTSYPFNRNGNGGYLIKSPKNTKKALTKEEISKIFHYKPQDGSIEMFYRDLWLFSYLCNGINIRDICNMKFEYIEGETIEFYRSKTKSAYKEPKKIEIIITAHVKNIIDRWGNNKESTYVFPILNNNMSAEVKHKKIKQTIKQCNKYIERVAMKIGVEKKIRSQYARHSFATILKRSGVSTSFISDSMAHSSETITEKYLGSFEDEKRKENLSNLTDWD